MISKLLCALFVCTLILPIVAQDVPLWGKFETRIDYQSLKGQSHSFSDPFYGVELNATFTSPTGRNITWWGFYDGNGSSGQTGDIWKIRFMPDELGRWRWRAEFSDGTAGGSGSFECVASDIEGMISVDSGNPMWFGFTGGGHILIRGLHVGDRFFASNWPAEKRTAFLDWFQGQGYNTLSIASHYLNRDVEGRGRGWETPRL